MVAADSRILVIDDEDSVREGIVAYLEDSGFAVYGASDGVAGLELFRQYEPDVVLCDLNMPNLDGMGVLKALAASAVDVPVIVISGVGVMSDVVQALRFGASDYLIKPIVDMEVLEHAVVRCLEQGKLRRENRLYRQQLEEANTELRQSLLLLEQDQQAGRQVQTKMLPATPRDFGALRFAHRIIPSLYLSGDFTDYFTVGESHVVFFIADVSGHGASSAFVTVMLKNLFARKRSDFAHKDDLTILSPVKMLERANQELLDTEIGKYVTMCVGVIDLNGKELLYSVAGHLPLPILITDDGCDYLSGEGMPVGLFEQAQYQQRVLILPEKFILSFFSDGILEVLPESGVIAKEKQLLEKLSTDIHSIDQATEVLGLGCIDDAPDDIAILLISKQ